MGIFTPDWPLPKGVEACITTREEGSSATPFDYFNLAQHVGDDSAQVLLNRKALIDRFDQLQAVQWLHQVHGIDCVEAGHDTQKADACITSRHQLGCAVMTADCLPVLFCDKAAHQVAAAHAGWRGLAGGVLAQTISNFQAPPSELTAYLGPAIGPSAFEVGLDVLEQFFASARSLQQLEAIAAAFKPSSKPLHFKADLYALARAELYALGISDVYGGKFCTYTEQERFYSYRRNNQTGRMASLIWLA